MRALLAPVGTRGDVQPMVALGQRLEAAGHQVTMAVAENFRSLVEGAGLAYVRGGDDVQSVVEGRGEGLTHPIHLVSLTRELIAQQLDAVDAACEGADLLVGSMLLCAGPTLAARRGIPFCVVSYFPTAFPSDAHPSPFASRATGPVWFNRMTWRAQRVLGNAAIRAPINRKRAQLGMPPITDIHDHVATASMAILATDAELAPPPAEWRSRVRVTGFWFLDSPEPLPADLEAFLDAGDPPVYVGFGSMPNDDPALRTEIIAEACATVSCRAVVGAGWGGLGGGRKGSHVHAVGAVNHRLLFDRVAAVVHHGGAGTTAAAARAGVPQILVPHIFDQFYWAGRVEALGLGPAPLRKRFATAELAAALRAVLGDPSMKDRSERMGHRLRKYSGADQAVALLERVVAGVV